jgi:2-methylcitrate dehydratase PrpD
MTQAATSGEIGEIGDAALELGRFVAETRFEDLQPELVERAKRHILDTFGAALAGSAAVESRAVQELLGAESIGGRAPVWGIGASLGTRDAAFANGVAAHALELDDTGGCDHSGAVVLPAVMSVLAATGEPVSGQDLITAVVLGYDIGRRVLEASGGYAAHNGKGWHSTATCGVFGAAAAAARILRLDARGCAWALGHAASFSGGLWAFIHDASQTKRLHAGRAAEGGVLAAQMAARGVTGPQGVFADVWGGFFRAFAAEHARPADLTAHLGAPWKLMRCSIKPHASCRSTHGAIDAVLHLLASHPGAAGKVRRIDVALSAFVMGMCGGRDLATLASAQMSMPYAVAVAWVFGDASLRRYLLPTRQEQRIEAAMRLVHLRVDPAMADLDEPLVTISVEGMAPLARRVAVALGAPANPLPDADLLAKFSRLAEVALSAAQADRLASAVMDLDRLADARSLLPMLHGTADAHELIS